MISQRHMKTMSFLTCMAAALTLSGCEKNDVKPTAELGTWYVDHYSAFNVGLIGASADAVTMCDYRGDGVNNVVYLDMSGTATAIFKKNGSSNYSSKVDGRTIRFENPTASYQEQRGSTTIYRQYNNAVGVAGYSVEVTAGNEKGINIVPKRDFVVAQHDNTKGVTKLILQHARTNRYIRIRTDYIGSETYTANDGSTQSRNVLVTDLYQVDCGGTSSSASVSSVSSSAAQPKLMKTHSGITLSRNAQAGDQL